MKEKKIDNNLLQMRKVFKEQLMKRYKHPLSERIWNIVKQVGFYFGVLIAFGMSFYNPISLAILCGTIVLIFYIRSVTK